MALPLDPVYLEGAEKANVSVTAVQDNCIALPLKAQHTKAIRMLIWLEMRDQRVFVEAETTEIFCFSDDESLLFVQKFYCFS